MITTKTIVDKYLETRGLHRIAGDEGDALAIMPFIIMDKANNMFCKYIQREKCSYRMEQWKKAWKSTYTEFNIEFFSIFNQEERDFIIDEMMEDFEGWINNQYTITYVQFMNAIDDEPLERQEVLATCMMISVLTQYAQIMWRAAYRHSSEKENRRLQIMENWQKKWRDGYRGTGKKHIDCNNNKQIRSCADALWRRIQDYLKNYYVNGNNNQESH